MFQGNNIPFACHNEVITIGRMKGNIKPGDKIFKIASHTLSESAKYTYLGNELKKIKLNCKITVKKDSPVCVSIVPGNSYENYKNIEVNIKSSIIPQIAINHPITKEKLITQFSKTNDTPFEFAHIDIDMDDNLYLPKLSEINGLRRDALEKLEKLIIRKFTRVPIHAIPKSFTDKIHSDPKITLALLDLNQNIDYTKLDSIDRVYIPLRCFRNVKNKNVLKSITSRFNTFIYLPTVMHSNYLNLFDSYISSFISSYDIKGFVLSNIGDLHFTKDDTYKDFKFVANYTLNIFNDYTLNAFYKNDIDTITLSPELDQISIQNIKSSTNKELIVYGRLKVMTSKYCLLGNSNGCYPTCDSKCKNMNSKYYLRDRMGFLFRVIPNNLQSVTNIYNSKILSIEHADLNIDYARIDILDEDIDKINNIISTVKAGKRFEGSNYTNGNINRFV